MVTGLTRWFMVAAALGFAPLQSKAASFNCAKAATRTEKMICSNVEISNADERLAKAFRVVLSLTNNSEALKQEQRAWLKGRDTIADASQLLNYYNERINELEGGTARNTRKRPVSTNPVASVEPEGRYLYKERGFAGEMLVTRVAVMPLTWRAEINTGNVSNGHSCTVEATGHNLVGTDNIIEASFESPAEEGFGPARFTVKFTKSGAEIDVQDPGGLCGMQGYFGGNYVKASAGKVKR